MFIVSLQKQSNSILISKNRGKITWVKREELFKEARKRFVDAEIVLDVGCGIRPQNFVKPKVQICFEPFRQYVDFLQEKVNGKSDRIYVIFQGNWDDAVKKLAPKSVDTVMLIDVVEHLKKADGRRLLKATEKITRRQIIIFTPLGFVPQEHPDGKDAWGLGGGAWQKHLSGWDPKKDFDRDWEIVGCKQFHFKNNRGETLDKPWGAFFAIKTFDSSLSRDKIFSLFTYTSDLSGRLTKKLKYFARIILDKGHLFYFVGKVLKKNKL
ncbi:MAG: hypothetical protein UY40_C0002G0055 [candidate division CPR1 bacterium GW2011_GWC1_49_13]|uniref:Methyltransferase type 11 domain-containing protein n=1 Tax=candidate division CPR1 bacterium GW2011_GWC1_49_13 TaxID=1618342 RepID=A0A0G1VJ18_9BACT|nr:MAG: hypothetical protein UY40_C0002G0055 [candidate division CPR1 bacterium GW2011_GWC1_49_13]